MSAHSFKALKCLCGGYFIFQEYHWPHCPANTKRQTTTTKELLNESGRQAAYSMQRAR